VVIFYLQGYLYFFGRLDSGGETSPKATFLATTLGLRRLFFSLEAISDPSLFSSFLKKIVFGIEKISLSPECYSKGKKPLFNERNVDVQSASFSARNPSTIAEFCATKG
jgi:hypothetical protein